MACAKGEECVLGTKCCGPDTPGCFQCGGSFCPPDAISCCRYSCVLKGQCCIYPESIGVQCGSQCCSELTGGNFCLRRPFGDGVCLYGPPHPPARFPLPPAPPPVPTPPSPAVCEGDRCAVSTSDALLRVSKNLTIATITLMCAGSPYVLNETLVFNGLNNGGGVRTMMADTACRQVTVNRNASETAPGNALSLLAGRLTVIGLSIMGGWLGVYEAGGGVRVAPGSHLHLIRSTVTGNTAGFGAGVYSAGSTSFENGTRVFGNQAVCAGSAVFTDSTTSIISDSFMNGTLYAFCPVSAIGCATVYRLPAPRFHFVPTFVSRCTVTICRDLPYFPAKRIPCARNFQPCPFFDNPALAGHVISELPNMLDAVLAICPAGYMGNSSDSIMQVSPACAGPCPAGMFCKALQEPQRCPVGTFSRGGGRSAQDCLSCPSGHYCPDPAEQPHACKAGFYGHQINLSSVACSGVCPIGHYCPTGTTTPFVCPSGTYGFRTNISDASECLECPLGHWCSQGSAYPCGQYLYTDASAPASSRTSLHACLPCPAGATTIGNATPSVDGCVCEPNQLTRPLTEVGAPDMCQSCPASATCAKPGTSLKTLIVDDAYWRPGHQSQTIRRCPHEGTCASGTTPDAVYDRFGDATCVPGHGLAGAYCQLCKDPTRYFSHGHCHSCNPGRTAASIIIPLVLLVLVGFALWRCQAMPWWKGAVFRRIALRSTFKIAVGFYQIVSQLTVVYSIDYYPPEYERVVNAFRMANLHVFAWLPDLQPSCLGMPSLLNQLLFVTLGPIVVALAAIAIVKLRGASLASALPFVLYWSFLVYPSVSSRGFRALAPCDCFYYLGANLNRTCLLRTDYEEQCTFGARPWPEPHILVVAWLAIIFYGIAVPALYAWLLARKSMAQSEALGFLTKDYEPHARWWELVEVVKKLTFTGFLALVDPGSFTQMYLAVVCSLTVLVVQLLVVPYRRRTDNMLATLSEVALAFTLLGTLGLDTSQYFPSPLVESNTIVAILIVAALIVIIAAVVMLLARLHAAHAAALTSDGGDIELPVLAADEYHLFLSHVWGTGQDQMRIVKQSVLALIPDAQVFLDVDQKDFKIGDLEGYVKRSSTVLIYVTEGYFASKNCMRELIASTRESKHIVALLDPEAVHGGLSRAEVDKQLHEAALRYDEWGFEADAPRGDQLVDALFADPPIEWNRVGAFQLVTIRLLVERILPDKHRGKAQVGGELTHQRLVPPHPSNGRHTVYCSPHNDGALELIREVEAACGMSIDVSTDATQMASCDLLLIYLNGKTWTSGDRSEAFADEVKTAMSGTANVPLLLAHEMPSAVDVGATRHSVEFKSFFGSTPEELIRMGIYHDVAIALKGGEWRRTSAAMVAQRLGATKGGWAIGCARGWERNITSLFARMMRQRNGVDPLIDTDDGVRMLEMRSARHSEVATLGNV